LLFFPLLLWWAALAFKRRTLRLDILAKFWRKYKTGAKLLYWRKNVLPKVENLFELRLPTYEQVLTHNDAPSSSSVG
jgi:hypothetical protein